MSVISQVLKASKIIKQSCNSRKVREVRKRGIYMILRWNRRNEKIKGRMCSCTNQGSCLCSGLSDLFICCIFLHKIPCLSVWKLMFSLCHNRLIVLFLKELVCNLIISFWKVPTILLSHLPEKKLRFTSQDQTPDFYCRLLVCRHMNNRLFYCNSAYADRKCRSGEGSVHFFLVCSSKRSSCCLRDNLIPSVCSSFPVTFLLFLFASL